MSDPVLDSSAVLALLLGEPGAERVAATLPGARLSTVNLAEIISKLCEKGMPTDQAYMAVESLGIEIVPFTAGQAVLSGSLRPLTRAFGLSLGDRACLALARDLDEHVLTADTAWAQVPGSRIILIRP